MKNSPRTREIRLAWMAWKRPSFLSQQLTVVESTVSKPATTAVYWVRPTGQQRRPDKSVFVVGGRIETLAGRCRLKEACCCCCCCRLSHAVTSRLAAATHADSHPSIHPSFSALRGLLMSVHRLDVISPSLTHSQYVSAILLAGLLGLSGHWRCHHITALRIIN